MPRGTDPKKPGWSRPYIRASWIRSMLKCRAYPQPRNVGAPTFAIFRLQFWVFWGCHWLKQIGVARGFPRGRELVAVGSVAQAGVPVPRGKRQPMALSLMMGGGMGWAVFGWAYPAYCPGFEGRG